MVLRVLRGENLPTHPPAHRPTGGTAPDHTASNPSTSQSTHFTWQSHPETRISPPPWMKSGPPDLSHRPTRSRLPHRHPGFPHHRSRWVATPLAPDRMGVTTPDDPLSVGTVQRQSIIEPMRLSGRNGYQRHHEPDIIPAAWVHDEHLPTRRVGSSHDFDPSRAG
jgi:hypothetical protein